jgi:hypothetical protein
LINTSQVACYESKEHASIAQAPVSRPKGCHFPRTLKEQAFDYLLFAEIRDYLGDRTQEERNIR